MCGCASCPYSLVGHFLSVPAEGVVERGWLTAAQCLPQATVERAEAPQAGDELPEDGEIGEGGKRIDIQADR